MVTVIIPTRNRADGLRAALASVYGQEGAGTELELDVIVVDDASTDRTGETVHQYPAIRYIRLDTNRGASAARNVGIKAGRGGYVAFLDDDDVWLPRKLERQVAALQAHPDAGIAYSPYVIRFPDRRELLSVGDDAPTGSIFRSLLLGNHCGSPIGAIIRRDALEAIGYFDESVSTAEDYDLWLRLAFRFPFVFVPGPVAVHPRTLQGKYSVHLTRGNPGCSTRYLVERAVLERALALLPDTVQDSRIKQEARAHLEIRITCALGDIGEFRLMQAQLLAALRRFPGLLQYGWARTGVSQMARRVAMRSASPLAATQAFCDTLTPLTGHRGITGWVRRKRTFGRVWADLAGALLARSRYSEAGRAAVRAVLLNPGLLPRKDMLRILTHGFLGSALQRLGLRPFRRGPDPGALRDPR